MAQLCGACSGLLVFSAMILSGLLSGNTVEVIVGRAICGLFLGFVLGAVVGQIGKHIVRDNVTREPEEAGVAEEVPAEATEVETATAAATE